MTKLVVLELNELNFDMVKEYAAAGEMPNFSRFIEAHGHAETTSEVSSVELEPWIQWVTVHTGKTFSEHRIFRLGDVETSQFPQIWEELEQSGLCVGAISPMNAANRLSGSPFFVPDPWTSTRTDGPWIMRQLASAISQAVNDNATSRITLQSLAGLLLGALRYARPANYGRYLTLFAALRKYPWNKVLILDLLLSDLFIGLNKSKSPQFSTIFFNGAAHLQHHYMYNSKVYRGGEKNPDWYIPASADPIGDIYRLYDRVIGQVVTSLPDHRVMLVTGLHQDATRRAKYYWRLRDHANFLKQLGLKFSAVHPRMSRDFLVTFHTAEDMQTAAAALEAATICDEPVFTVDRRDATNTLFVELTYSADIGSPSELHCNGQRVKNFRDAVAFVALKNGQHNGIGYFSDSGRSKAAMPGSMPLTQVFDEMKLAFGAAKS